MHFTHASTNFFSWVPHVWSLPCFLGCIDQPHVILRPLSSFPRGFSHQHSWSLSSFPFSGFSRSLAVNTTFFFRTSCSSFLFFFVQILCLILMSLDSVMLENTYIFLYCFPANVVHFFLVLYYWPQSNSCVPFLPIFLRSLITKSHDICLITFSFLLGFTCHAGF